MRQAPGIYMISMVAETLEMHPQTLRKYERAGFIEPLRMGTLRTYSDADVARLRLIKHFVEGMGLNLSGVELALRMSSQLLDLRSVVSKQGTRSGSNLESLKMIDEMLASMGIRVVQRPQEADGRELPKPGDAWFRVNPGESVEFNLEQSASVNKGSAT